MTLRLATGPVSGRAGSLVAAVLAEHRHRGWATVERDRLSGGDAVADLVASRRVLEGLSLSEPGPAR